MVSDIQRQGASVFRSVDRRLNMRGKRTIRVPILPALKLACAFFAIWMMFGGNAIAPTESFAANVTSQDPSAERQALEAQLKTLESQMDAYQGQISSYSAQGKNLKGEIAKLNAKISSLSLEIKAVGLSLTQLNNQIRDTQTKIGDIQNTIESQKTSLAGLLRYLYAGDQVSMIEVFLKSPRFTDFFSDMNNIELLQNKVRTTIRQIIDLRDQLEDQQQQLTLARADAVTIQQYKESQKTEVDQLKGTKNNLLEVTKGQESKYQSLLALTKQTAAQIRSRIFQLLGGGELSFEQAYDYAKLAGTSTGIRPALVLAILDRESALGQNVGKCNYKTAMSPGVPPKSGKRDDISVFLALTSQLGINPDTISVSCANKDGAFGGAMGPAQFIPTTWNLYTKQISKITNHTPASPWNNADAFVATALYLKDSITGCKAVYSAQTSIERCAAAKYYAGSRWRTYLSSYGQAVISRANSFQDDIKEIEG